MAAGQATAHARRAPAESGPRRAGRRKGAGRRGDDGSREQLNVPRAEFRSYYGRPVLKAPVWGWKIPAYLFTGGLAAGAALLAGGRRPNRAPGPAPGQQPRQLRCPAGQRGPARRGPRAAGALPPHAAGGEAQLPDERRHLDPGGLRTGLRSGGRGGSSAVRAAWHAARPPARDRPPARPGCRPPSSPRASRPTRRSCWPQTSVPAWHEVRRELPFVYTGIGSGQRRRVWARSCAPVDEAAPARRLAAAGAAGELIASAVIDRRPTLLAQGVPHRVGASAAPVVGAPHPGPARRRHCPWPAVTGWPQPRPGWP